jgi:hypothetical protein
LYATDQTVPEDYAAVREASLADMASFTPSMNLAAVEELEEKLPEGDVVLIKSGGDNLTLTFSPALVDFFIYVIDVAAGDCSRRCTGTSTCPGCPACTSSRRRAACSKETGLTYPSRSALVPWRMSQRSRQ